MVSQIACPVLYNLLNLKKMVSFKSAFSPAQIKEDLWLKTFGILQNKSTKVADPLFKSNSELQVSRRTLNC